MFKQLGGFSFRYFVEFEWELKLFVLFSFKPTTKPANGNRSTFLGAFGFQVGFANGNRSTFLGAFGFQVGFECQFFLSINSYTGSYCILLSVFSLLFPAK